MGSATAQPGISPAYCTKCGSPLTATDKFCSKCGVPQTADAAAVKPEEFERQLRVAWSCLKDVEHKADAIRQAKDASDREVEEGTFRGTLAMSALQGRLEGEFQENLNLAWNSATKAAQIDPAGSIQADDCQVTPNRVFAGVCMLRGDLEFAMDRWQQAVGFYNQASPYDPENPALFYNIAVAYTNKHDPGPAVSAFRRVIELDPVGSCGIEAAKHLARLEAGTLGRKGFTGSWKVVAVLAGLALIGLFMIARSPGPALFGLVFWGGILAIYWRRKFK
jgi:tetratricopeptide (TPR) repeat protein